MEVFCKRGMSSSQRFHDFPYIFCQVFFSVMKKLILHAILSLKQDTFFRPMYSNPVCDVLAPMFLRLQRKERNIKDRFCSSTDDFTTPEASRKRSKATEARSLCVFISAKFAF